MKFIKTFFMAMAFAMTAQVAMATECGADISKQLKQEQGFQINVRAESLLCVEMDEPIVSVEYRKEEYRKEEYRNDIVGEMLRWQTPQEGGYSMTLAAMQEKDPMKWDTIMPNDHKLTMQAREDAYPVIVKIKTASGKEFNFTAAQINDLDYYY